MNAKKNKRAASVGGLVFVGFPGKSGLFASNTLIRRSTLSASESTAEISNWSPLNMTDMGRPTALAVIAVLSAIAVDP
jgi:hypothetical protein